VDGWTDGWLWLADEKKDEKKDDKKEDEKKDKGSGDRLFGARSRVWLLTACCALGVAVRCGGLHAQRTRKTESAADVAATEAIVAATEADVAATEAIGAAVPLPCPGLALALFCSDRVRRCVGR
jgi:hypothetical protein